MTELIGKIGQEQHYGLGEQTHIFQVALVLIGDTIGATLGIINFVEALCATGPFFYHSDWQVGEAACLQIYQFKFLQNAAGKKYLKKSSALKNPRDFRTIQVLKEKLLTTSSAHLLS